MRMEKEMKRIFAFGLSCLLALGCWTPAFAEEYRLRYGDALRITVIEHPEMTLEAQPVRPDGRISLPLIADVPVQGKTVPEVAQFLKKAYGGILTRPEVVVSVVKFRPLRVTVLGQVHRPGTYSFEEPPVLSDVLASAEGLTKRAVRNSIRVVLPGGTTKTYDLERLLSGKEASPALVEGSVIEVPEIWGLDLDQGLMIFTSIVGSALLLLRNW